MKQQRIIFCIFLSLIFLIASVQAENLLDIKLRVFEGTKLGGVEPPKFVTSSYLQPTITASVQTELELTNEIGQIKRVFNLKDANLLTEADLGLDLKNPVSMNHFFRLNGNAYEIYVHLVDWGNKGGEFLIVVNEQMENKKENILTTEILLMGGNSAVFGFEDRKGKPYFLSFHITGPKDKILPPPPPPPPPPPGYKQMKEKMDKFSEGAVKAVGMIKPPKHVCVINPIYPEKARANGIEGVVLLSVKTDEKGDVEDALVLRTPDPIFEKPAIDAVKQWKYETLFVQGKAHKAVFSVSVRFKLSGEDSGDITSGAVEAGGEIEPPKPIKAVDPVYPELARAAGIQGTVILHIRIDEQGNVEKIKVLKSIPELDMAAMDAVRKWKYEPFFSKGKATPLVFTVSVRFKLK